MRESRSGGGHPRSGEPARASGSLRQRLAVATLLAATVLLAFSPVLDGGFLSLDDQLYVTANARVLSGLSWEGTAWAFRALDAGYWHPLTWLSYMADVTASGTNPRWFHAVNLGVHLVNAVLLLLVLADMTGSFWKSALVSFLFALHPLRVESVAWVAERKDVLFAACWLLATGAYLRHVRRPGRGRYLAVVLLFALGLMAKPMIVSLPFVLLLLDFWPLGRLRFAGAGAGGRAGENAHPRDLPPLRRLLLEKVPLAALAALASGIAFVAQERASAVGSLQRFPAPARVANAAVSYLAYLGDTLWPARLAVIYPHPPHGVAGWQAAGAGLLLAAISAALLLAGARKRPAAAVGWLWFLGTLVPVIGLVQIGLQSRADRFTYVPQIGLGLLLAWGIAGADGVRRARRFLLVPAAVLAVVALAALTRVQAGYWRDDDTLLAHAIGSTADNWPAHRFLALSLQQRGLRDEAAAHVREVQRIRPEFVQGHAAFGLSSPGRQAPEADEEAVRENSRGTALSGQGRPDEAIEAFRRALAVSPGFVAARLNLANALAHRGRSEEAVREYREVLALVPRHGLALNNLAGVLTLSGRTREAVAYYRQAVEAQPKNADIRANLGRALFELGESEEALAAYHKAAQADRRYLAEMAGLAETLRAGGDADGARRWYRRALDLSPGDPALARKLEQVR